VQSRALRGKQTSILSLCGWFNAFLHLGHRFEPRLIVTSTFSTISALGTRAAYTSLDRFLAIIFCHLPTNTAHFLLAVGTFLWRNMPPVAPALSLLTLSMDGSSPTCRTPFTTALHFKLFAPTLYVATSVISYICFCTPRTMPAHLPPCHYIFSLLFTYISLPTTARCLPALPTLPHLLTVVVLFIVLADGGLEAVPP